MNYAYMTAPCGRDCFNCPVYLAGQNEKMQRIVSKKLDIPIEKAVCRGCRAENGKIPFLNMTNSCKILKCTDEKGIGFCCECEDFPCDLLHPLAHLADKFAHNTKVFNLCLIKKMGLEVWAKNKAKSVFENYFKGSLKNLIE